MWPCGPHAHSPVVLHQPLVHLRRERLDPLTQLLGEPGQLGVLLEQLQQLCGLLQGERLALVARRRQGLPVVSVRVRVRLVPVRLARLREQDEGRGIGRLEAKGEVQQNEGIEVERPRSWRRPSRLDDDRENA